MSEAEDVDAEVAGLYAEAPDDFVAGRDALAGRLRAEHDRVGATRVKGLRRPTAAAWVLNLLARTEPGQLDDLAQLGQALREAHQVLSAEQLRPLAAQRTQVVEALVRRAAQLAADHGRKTSESVRGEVAATLQAALVDPGVHAEVAAGRLARPVAYGGFGDLPEAGGARVGQPVASLERARERRAGRGEQPASGQAAGDQEDGNEDVEEQDAGDRRAARERERAHREALVGARRRLATSTEALSEAEAEQREAAEQHRAGCDELDHAAQEVADLQAELSAAEQRAAAAEEEVARRRELLDAAEQTLTAARQQQDEDREALQGLEQD